MHRYYGNAQKLHLFGFFLDCFCINFTSNLCNVYSMLKEKRIIDSKYMWVFFNKQKKTYKNKFTLLLANLSVLS